MKLQGRIDKTLGEHRLYCGGVRFAILLFWLLAFIAKVQAQPLLPVSWAATEKQDHPLVGQFWSTREQLQYSLPEWLAQRLRGHWVFLGEQHDHPDHQQIAVLWLRALADQEAGVVLALEMATQAQQAALDAHLGEAEVVADDLAWNPGWPWSAYGDLVQTGMQLADRVLALDLPREDQMRAYRQGAPQSALSEAMAAALDLLIDQGHCELLPSSQLPAMRQVQLARDQAMAARLAEVDLTGRSGLVLAGSVHVRRDLGISRWLPDSTLRSSVLLQAVDERTHWADYLPSGIEGIAAFDYILFTPAIPPVDYCAELEARMSGH